ncbi:MAG: hypothetical protein AB7H77_11990 [Bdellovibrionales bacterium]
MAMPTGDEWAKLGQSLLAFFAKYADGILSFFVGIGWVKAQQKEQIMQAMKVRIESENEAANSTSKRKFDFLRNRPGDK